MKLKGIILLNIIIFADFSVIYAGSSVPPAPGIPSGSKQSCESALQEDSIEALLEQDIGNIETINDLTKVFERLSSRQKIELYRSLVPFDEFMTILRILFPDTKEHVLETFVFILQSHFWINKNNVSPGELYHRVFESSDWYHAQESVRLDLHRFGALVLPIRHESVLKTAQDIDRKMRIYRNIIETSIDYATDSYYELWVFSLKRKMFGWSIDQVDSQAKITDFEQDALLSSRAYRETCEISDSDFEASRELARVYEVHGIAIPDNFVEIVDAMIGAVQENIDKDELSYAQRALRLIDRHFDQYYFHLRGLVFSGSDKHSTSLMLDFESLEDEKTRLMGYVLEALFSIKNEFQFKIFRKLLIKKRPVFSVGNRSSMKFTPFVADPIWRIIDSISSENSALVFDYIDADVDLGHYNNWVAFMFDIRHSVTGAAHLLAKPLSLRQQKVFRYVFIDLNLERYLPGVYESAAVDGIEMKGVPRRFLQKILVNAETMRFDDVVDELKELIRNVYKDTSGARVISPQQMLDYLEKPSE